MGFHFHEGISQGGIGSAPLWEGTFWMPELTSVCHDQHSPKGSWDSTHPLCCSLQLQPQLHTGLGTLRRCKFEHTWDEVASITEKELFVNS